MKIFKNSGRYRVQVFHFCNVEEWKKIMASKGGYVQTYQLTQLCIWAKMKNIVLQDSIHKKIDSTLRSR